MTTEAPLIEVTDLAARKLEEVLADQDKPGNMLRVVVMPGPGGALQYMLGVEERPGDDDVVVETDSVSMLVDADSAPLIEGASIDYVEGLMRSGFVISNPNAPVAGCACGGGGCGGGDDSGCGGHGGGGGCGGHGGGGGLRRRLGPAGMGPAAGPPHRADAPSPRP